MHCITNLDYDKILESSIALLVKKGHVDTISTFCKLFELGLDMLNNVKVISVRNWMIALSCVNVDSDFFIEIADDWKAAEVSVVCED